MDYVLLSSKLCPSRLWVNPLSKHVETQSYLEYTQHTSGGYSKYRECTADIILVTSWILHYCCAEPRFQGKLGNPIDCLVYVKHVELDDCPYLLACIPTSPMVTTTLRLNSPKWLLRWVGIERWNLEIPSKKRRKTCNLKELKAGVRSGCSIWGAAFKCSIVRCPCAFRLRCRLAQDERRGFSLHSKFSHRRFLQMSMYISSAQARTSWAARTGCLHLLCGIFNVNSRLVPL